MAAWADYDSMYWSISCILYENLLLFIHLVIH